ncbi:hypothetical protein K431DRAFT_312639 [Polychaeton citri CBS 116435]|uniref:Protein CSN12 homolog n=1 Tax=Polychaeton citri CBS 116435 TaxID=1314669 RepID=A0A9P4QAF0_9PEZI|nr:hypothetical protein K431DRAFT_312639 [Polychaeton citri CBS 116435]
MDAIFADFATAHASSNGYLLSTTISPTPAKPAQLYDFYRSTNAHSVQTDLRYKLQYNPSLQLSKAEASAWQEVFAAFYKFVGVLLQAEEAEHAVTSGSRGADWCAVYESWKEVVNPLYNAYAKNNFQAWTIPCIYVAGRFLRVFAIKADDSVASQRLESGMAFDDAVEAGDAFGAGSRNERLEDAARQINRIFGLCISDRNPIEDSRKWALYYVANLLFKIYFRLNQVGLCKNILQALTSSSSSATSEMPPLSSFPKSHQVTFKYYVGVIRFLDEDYAAAEEHLQAAYIACNIQAEKNRRLILMYLIPTKLLTTNRVPKRDLLEPYPSLDRLFGPVSKCIRSADLAAFERALSGGETEFVKRRIYLTLERGRDIILRNLFRKVFIAGGYLDPKPESPPDVPRERRSRVPIAEFAAALAISGAEVKDMDGNLDMDEVECMAANLIYKGLMKGYIARERGIVVLSRKNDAFPGTGV